jgi:AmmeMemoRadiSam system protein A
MNKNLTETEQNILLSIARQAITKATSGLPLDPIDLSPYSPALVSPGASFVTLTKADSGELKGCIGILEARQPLILDVQEHAVAAALEDYRFPPLRFEELNDICIEISRLTNPIELDYDNPGDLAKLLRPGVDGVVLRDGRMRATFLPQVWDKLPQPEEFLTNLCTKMGASGDLWRRKKLQVLVYQVEEFHE